MRSVSDEFNACSLKDQMPLLVDELYVLAADYNERHSKAKRRFQIEEITSRLYNAAKQGETKVTINRRESLTDEVMEHFKEQGLRVVKNPENASYIRRGDIGVWYEFSGWK